MPSPFYPPSTPHSLGVLHRWAAPLPPAWARAVIEATTRPGDLVLDPFCQGEAVARIALELGRSVAAADFNPVQTLAARAAIAPPAPQTLARATSRLADVVKIDRPLREAVQALYLTTCPHCQARVAAESFTWDASVGIPTRKTLTCPQCGWRGAAPADTDDAARATEIEPLSLSHFFLIERLAGQTDALRPLAERLVNLYTPRAQRALADLIRYLDPLDLSSDEGEAVRMVILGCLDACSTLNAAPWDPQPPRRLDTPRRYVELNVWHAFETLTGSLRQTPAPPDAEWVGEAGQVRTGTTRPYAFVGRLPARALAEALAGRASLALGAPPRMNPLFWTLSWAWASWLWSPRAATALRPLVGRHPGDWDWYAGALTAALTGLRTALRSDGQLALRWAGDYGAHGAVLVGAARAGFRLTDATGRLPRAGARWLEVQAQFSRQPETPPRLALDQFGAVSQALEEGAVVAAAYLLETQGEPLHAETLARLALDEAAREGRLGQALGLFEDAMLGLEFAQAKLGDGLAVAQARGVLRRLEDGRLWLADTTGAAVSLGERVERVVVERLEEIGREGRVGRGGRQGSEGSKERAGSEESGESEEAEGRILPTLPTLPVSSLYAAFPGPLAPDTELVTLCLEAHGRQVTPSEWIAQAGVEPLKQAVNDLVILGEALGYSVQFPLPWAVTAEAALEPLEVVWFAGGRPATRFVLQASALLTPHTAALPHTVPHCLVLTERVARLARHKLHRAPALAQVLVERGWDFLIAERLHSWFTQPLVDPETWEEVCGLEERSPGEGQLRLFER
ncbi:MAG: hypothetical protein KIT87_24510 [Anaerolineae bacterium]|nr:hypothetical protein [Anaerolineae bacterium]